ncbi:M20/M25/M40 family metallo-hydrolase [Hymenobacter sp. BT770]|uniref:M20/M25/M40 family metallo-hydrolase n=1 Tax=Hymenobacter sp. BT770 TaxID=2886942 RepID=UPI001D12C594|nr:M20/M25/M40 family metallo-hydrolase [Hymenobacter sp. BT770]MCC3153514.1 M20/M25/M40 family metallo-hydrolase [Hymenobacter sp. BT770]MDO3415751.1 M20/M25/M40 family metallo-hydrolase [Hymenobacter sp. BT770]
MKAHLLTLALALTALTAPAQRRKAPKAAPATPLVSAVTVGRVLTTLAGDAMQGRGTGQPGGLKAAQFLAGEFQRIGLLPLPGATGFEQVFPVYSSRVAGLSATLNGAAIPADKLLLVSNQPTVEWTQQTPDLEVLTITTNGDFGQVLSKIRRPSQNLLVLLDPIHSADFKKLVDSRRQVRFRATEAGSPYSCVVLVTPTAPSLANNARAKSITFEVKGKTEQVVTELRNVVGMLPGRDTARAKEKVVFSGHYDHLGIIKPSAAGDSIANGADDDASGTTAVVALAEYFKLKNDNARPLIFTAFAAEEVGGFGARYFSQQLAPQQVVAMFNIEMIGKEAKFGPNTAFITGFDKSDFGKLLQANLTGSKFRFEPDPYPEQNLFYRSDNATLAKLGVPAHTISSDQIPDDKLYHSVDDEVESLNLPNMTAIIQAIAQSASGIVAGRQTPTRIAPEPAASK